MASRPGLDARGRARGGSVLRGIAYALLLGESLVIRVPSVYGRAAPKLFGFPFFYWFPLLWIIGGLVVTGLAYLLLARADQLDWERLLRRFGPNWRVLFSHMVLFGFIYPSESQRLPRSASSRASSTAFPRGSSSAAPPEKWSSMRGRPSGAGG